MRTISAFADLPLNGAELPASRQQRLISALLIVYILGAHLRLSLYANGSILVPMYLMLFSSAALALWFAPALLRRAGGLLALTLAFLLLQPLAGGGDSGYGSSLRSVLQLTASMLGAMAVIFALGRLDPARLRRTLLIVWAVLIVLAFAESLFLKPLFDQIRDLLYSGSGRFVYLAEDRDLHIYGRVRTTVFASEPSFLADTLSALSVMVFLLHDRRGRLGSWLQLGAMLALGFFISPSFKMAFYLAAVLVWQFWPRSLGAFFGLLALLATGALLGALLFEPLLALLQDTAGTHLSSGSFFGRIGSAHLVGMNALAEFPLFGFGVGNNDDVYRIIAATWQDSGAFIRFPWYSALPAADLMSNGFWWMWIYLGLIGGAVFLTLAALLLRALGVLTPWRSLICALILWYAGSAFVDPQSWYMLVVFSVGALARAPLPGAGGPR